MEYLLVVALGWVVVPVVVLLALYVVIRLAVRHALTDVRSRETASPDPRR